MLTSASEELWCQKIPEWFLENNITVPSDQEVSFSPIPWIEECPNADGAHSYTTIENQTSLSEGNCGWKTSWQDYQQLCDTTASALAGAALRLVQSQQSAIILQVKDGANIEPLDAMVARLAQDFDATLISFDLGDLQDVAWEFDLQHVERCRFDLPRPEPDFWTWPDLAHTSLADVVFDYHFVTLSNGNATWKVDGPVPQPTAAIIDAPKAKARQKMLDQNSNSRSTELSNCATLVHIRNVDEFLKRPQGLSCIENFGNIIRQRRTNGEKTLLIVSTTSHQVLPQEERDPFLDLSLLEQMPQKLQVPAESVLSISATRFPPSENETRQKILCYARQIRRAVRQNISQELLVLCNHLVEPYPKTNFAQDSDVISILGAAELSNTNAQRAARQICGKAARSQALTVSDIIVVLKSIHHKQPEQKISATERFKLKLKELERECNKYEKTMLDCVVDTNQLETKYEDVIIENETKETVKQLISLSQMSPQAHPLLRQVQMKGALFYGPPGTGKTHLTRAIAQESGASMVAVDAGRLLNQWVGETEKNILALFSVCRKLYPCILFIDEADALFYRRNSRDLSWRRNDVTLFLQQMDGLLIDKDAPFVIVATNRPSDLDEAFLRRLPYKAQFGLPTEIQRANILRLFLKDGDIDDPIIIEQLARKTEGYSGADLKSLCGQAALVWSVEQNSAQTLVEKAEKPKLLLTANHFTKALKRSRPAAVRETMKMNEDFRQETAVRTRVRM